MWRCCHPSGMVWSLAIMRGWILISELFCAAESFSESIRNDWTH